MGALQSLADRDPAVKRLLRLDKGDYAAASPRIMHGQDIEYITSTPKTTARQLARAYHQDPIYLTFAIAEAIGNVAILFGLSHKSSPNHIFEIAYAIVNAFAVYIKEHDINLTAYGSAFAHTVIDSDTTASAEARQLLEKGFIMGFQESGKTFRRFGNYQSGSRRRS